MESKQFSPTTLILVVVCTALVAAGAVYYALQHTYQVQQAALASQVAELQAQVDSLESQLQQNRIKPAPVDGRELRSAIQAEGDEILTALKNKDAATLAQYVHPQKGLRFTPYTYIDTSKDLVFPAADLPALFTGSTTYTWGSFDGSGEPIALTFSAYYSRFVYDKNFLTAPQTVYNQVLQRGNMINNFATAYPQAVSLEYHFPGFEPQYEGMDWESLKLAFEPIGSTWYLVGIIHEQWTI